MGLLLARITVLSFAVLWAGISLSDAAAPPDALQSAPTELELAAFRAELDRLSNQVALLENGGTTVQSLRSSLPTTWIVHDRDQRFEVPTARIQSALDRFGKPGAPPAAVLRDIQQELLSLRQEAESYARAQAFAGADAQAKLSHILSRREFSAVHPPSRLQRWFAWLVERFFRLLGRILDFIPFRSVTSQVLVWVLIAIVFIFLALLLRRTLQSAARSTSLQLEPAPASDRNWREWFQKAQAAALQGDYRAALHAAYWSAVSRLEELGIWTVDHSRTPREYLSLLDPQGTQRPAMAALTSRFEMTWYGYRDAAPEDFREALAHLEALGCRLPSTLATAKS